VRRERFLVAGFDDYVAKPLDIREVPRQVAAALAAARVSA
jgi:DNA-binding response OmpR family regulator